MKAVPLLATIAALGILSACGGAGPTTPSSSGSPRYDGQWSGTTSQGGAITFSVSPEQKVTAIVVDYSFNGCSGTRTFSNLTIDIGNPPTPTAPSLGPGFGYGSGPPEGPDYTQVLGNFTASTTALGSVIFGAYTGCGTAFGIWSATKR